MSGKYEIFSIVRDLKKDRHKVSISSYELEMKKLTWTILWSWFEFKTPRALLLIPKKLDFAFDHRSRAAIVLLSSSLIFSPDFLFLPNTEKRVLFLL